MSWLYQEQKGGYQVGFFTPAQGRWVPADIWCAVREDAAERVSFLNGGPNPVAAALMIDMAEKLREKL